MITPNPYSPPVTTSEDLLPREPTPFALTRQQLLKMAALCTVIAIISVLSFQLTFGSRNTGRSFPLMALESISFGAPVVAALFLVGYRGCQQNRERALAISIGCSALALSFMGVAKYASGTIGSMIGMIASIPLFLFIPMVIVLLAILFMRGAQIRLGWVVLAGIVASAAWVGLTFLIIVALVKHLPNPFDDYVGYSSLTVFWVWSVFFQIPIATKLQVQPVSIDVASIR